MVIGIIGGTGFLGTEIAAFLTQQGHTVFVFSRQPKLADQLYCNLSKLDGWETQLNTIDCLINLAGLSIGDGLWTKQRMKRLYDSRVLTTQLLVQALSQLSTPPKLFLSASAIGFYQDHTDIEHVHAAIETDLPGQSFLSNLCKDWEMEAARAPATVRVCMLRLGMVIGTGGLLKKIAPLFRLALGHYFGKGTAPFSWIHSKDLVQIVSFLMASESIKGPINCVSPQATTYKGFATTLSQCLNRPLIFRIPACLILILGPMSDLFLKGNLAYPHALISHGFTFQYLKLKDALNEALHGSPTPT